MTVAFWCVAVAAILPYVFVGYAKSTRTYVVGGKNRAPRLYAEELDGPRKRAYWAQLNGFEAFPPFAASVAIASLANAPSAPVDALAIFFVACRTLHGVCYIADWATARSIAWSLGLGTVVAIFIAASGTLG